jgi:hypothetical protein
MKSKFYKTCLKIVQVTLLLTYQSSLKGNAK